MESPAQSGRRGPRPLWGFGLAGWLLAPVAIALLAVWLMGYDLRFHLLRFIINAWGWEALVWFVTTFLAGHYLSLFSPQFGTYSLTYALIAMHLANPRVRAREFFVVVLCALVLPVLPFVAISLHLMGTRPLLVTLNHDMVVAGGDLVAAAVFGWISRRIWVFAALAALAIGEGAFSAGVTSTGVYIGTSMRYGACLLWHALFAAVLIGWALRSRRTIPQWCCQRCGYDLRGSPGQPCPECGAAAPLAAP